MDILKGIGKVAKKAGEWAVKNPDTVFRAAETGFDMHERSKASKQGFTDGDHLSSLIEEHDNDIALLDVKMNEIYEKVNSFSNEAQDKIQELQHETEEINSKIENVNNSLKHLILEQKKKFTMQCIVFSVGVIIAIVLSLF
jgi:FtsZ-binding cell division protein ZapB